MEKRREEEELKRKMKEGIRDGRKEGVIKGKRNMNEGGGKRRK